MITRASFLCFTLFLLFACEEETPDEGPGVSSAMVRECDEPGDSNERFSSNSVSIPGSCQNRARFSSNRVQIDGLDWIVNSEVSSSTRDERCFVTIDFEASIEKDGVDYSVDPIDVNLSLCRAALMSADANALLVLDPILEELVFDESEVALEAPLAMSRDEPRNEACSDLGLLFELEDFRGLYQARISVNRDYAHLLDFVFVDLALRVVDDAVH